MPPKRPKARVATPRATRSRARREADDSATSSVPKVFRDMLADVGQPTTRPDSNDRPLKRRRVGDVPPVVHAPEAFSEPAGESDDAQPRHVQTIMLESSDSDESDFEWEDVDLKGGNDDPSNNARGVSIAFDEKNNGAAKKSRSARPAVTAAFRKMRLDVHKLHICCLLYHNFLRNSYCNDPLGQAQLAKYITPSLKAKLDPDQTLTQGRRGYLFTEALGLVLELWKSKFGITRTGLHRPHWKTGSDMFKLSDLAELVLNRVDFREAAKELEGSADLGAQLLCAFLRSAGVTTRLVCSLQPLPFGTAGAGVFSTPQKEKYAKKTVYADASDGDDAPEIEPTGTSGPSNATDSPIAPRRITRMGQSRAAHSAVDMGKPPPSRTRQTLPRPNYPLYWVEAFNKAQQKWVALDAVATLTVGKPARLEPPANDPSNCMSYVIAFEDDGSAKDVTRRYAKAYNAKTRKLRVESTEGGERWFRKALKMFQRREQLDRDQIEDAELSKKENSEEMPRNVQDFKNHPYYVLERHLRHNEIIYPAHEVGKVNSGGAAHGKLESVYRRKDVRIVRSAAKWYRLGREIKQGQQPMKRAKPRRERVRNRSPSPMAGDDEETAGAGLYAGFQTEAYIPPPVVGGRVPRNRFGNLDVYVPSMVPPGGVHIRAKEAAKAARVVGVDYADAVTGFKFQGRQGTAVIEGVVVAAEYQDAVEDVLRGFREKRERALLGKRSEEALRLWRRFLAGLRITERLEEDYGMLGGQPDEEEADLLEELDRLEDLSRDDVAGGFFPDANATASPKPSRRFQHDDHRDDRWLLSRGDALFGFEGVELTRNRTSSRHLISLYDSEDEAAARLQDEFKDPHGLSNEFDGSSHTSKPRPSTLVEDSRQSIGNSHTMTEHIYGGGFMANNTANDGDDAGGFIMDGKMDGTRVEASDSDARNIGVAGNEQQQPNEPNDTGESQSAQRAQDGPADNATSDDERASLLSHDPEDDDAEPEWLLDVMEG